MPLSDPADPRTTAGPTPAGEPADVTRQRLLELLESEIRKAADGALARGADPGSLSAYLVSRAALLRTEIAAASRAAGDDGADRGDDAA